MNLADYIRAIPDFPKPGILFRDITPLLANPAAFRQAVVGMAEPFRQENIDVVAAAEARGFIFAAPVALELNAALAPIRKPGKLPFETHSLTYELEYGSDTLEMHTDAVSPGDRVLGGRRSSGHRRDDRSLLSAGRAGRRRRHRVLVSDRANRA